MPKITRFVGLDVHAATISVAVAEKGGEVRSLGIIANRPDAVRKVFRKLGPPDALHACYEAGACGYVLYWQLAELGVRCEVGCAVARASQVRRPREDRPPRCREAREVPPRR